MAIFFWLLSETILRTRKNIICNFFAILKKRKHDLWFIALSLRHRNIQNNIKKCEDIVSLFDSVIFIITLMSVMIFRGSIYIFFFKINEKFKPNLFWHDVQSNINGKNLKKIFCGIFWASDFCLFCKWDGKMLQTTQFVNYFID